MTVKEVSSCPYLVREMKSKQEKYRVTLRIAKEKEIIEHSTTCCGRIWTFLAEGPQRASNTFKLWKEMQISAVAKKAYEAKWMAAVPIMNTTWFMTKNELVMKSVVKTHRNGTKDNSLFKVGKQSEVFYELGQRIFYDRNFTKEDIIVTCSDQSSPLYRGSILDELSQKKVKEEQNKNFLRDLIKDFLGKLSNIQESQGEVNITKEIGCFTSGVISKLLLGNEGPYDEISEALDIISQYTLRRFLKSTDTKEETEKMSKAVDVIREAIETSYNSQCNFMQKIKTVYNTKEQVELNVLMLNIAGRDTTSAVMVMIFYHLARSSELQQEIFEEIMENESCRQYFEGGATGEIPADLDQLKSVNRVYKEGFRHATPVYTLGRETKHALMLEVSKRKKGVKKKDEKLVFSQFIPENHIIFPLIHYSANDPERFLDPKKFDPHRFEGHEEGLPFLGFGEGAHKCPGSFFAEEEIRLSLPFFIWNFSFELSNNEEIGYKEGITLSLDKDVHLRLKPRNHD